MSLEIAHREREGIKLIDLKGRIVVGEEASIFRSAIEGLAADPGLQLILNMREVDYVDSTGLGALVMCSTRVRNASGVAKLVHVNRRNI